MGRLLQKTCLPRRWPGRCPVTTYIAPGSPAEILAYRRTICRGCRYCGNRLTPTRVAHGSCLRADCKQAAKAGDPGHPNRTCGCEPTNPEHAPAPRPSNDWADFFAGGGL